MSERYSAKPNSLEVGADFPHCARYLLARGFIKKGETVIDAACGHGYGSYLLSEVADKVYSFDYQDVFNSEWNKENIEFNQENVEEIKAFPECDAFVSIETIEHLYNPELFLDKVTKATKRVIVMSSPNKPTVGLTEFHHTDVLLANFEKYMAKYSEWILYHTFIQGYTWLAIYLKKGTKFV
jgi:2-polyprenyl-3-methyl-5-hydroxy-6-metoxy-1,4-benzoquinol methylase